MTEEHGATAAGPPPEGRMVTITCLGRTGVEMAKLEVPAGTVLLRALETINFVAGPCGGFGSCGGCAVELDDGRIVQSCFITVEEDLTVRKIRYW